MKRSTIIITTTVALTFSIVGGAVAFGKHKFGSPAVRAEYVMNYVSDELNLDSTQEHALEALKDEIMATRLKMRDQIRPMHDELKTMISAMTFDQAKALKMIDSKTAAVNEVAPGIIAALGNFLDGLNTEQKVEIMSFLDHRAEHHRHAHYHD